MARKKEYNIVLAYGDSGYYINDLGVFKSPRFELFNEKTEEIIMKADDPRDCHKWIRNNIWKDFYNVEITEEETERASETKRKSRKSSKSIK